MQQLLQYILQGIVDHPDEVKVDLQESEYGYVTLDLTVDPEDMGKVIGKKGKVIDAIRKVAKVKAVIDGKRIHINLIDPQAPKKD